MEQLQNTSIKLKEQLNQQDYEDIKNLEKYCVENDQVSLKLELDYKLSKPLNKSVGIKLINEFMFYNDETLIGYIGICQFNGETLEVNGMVLPPYRRQGVFSKLFSVVKDEWSNRKPVDMLLLSDHNSLSGLAFIKQTDAQYDNSEYEMLLKGDPKLGTTLHDLTLRKANNNDAKEIARQNEIYFHIDAKEADLILPEEEANKGLNIYLAEYENVIIGKVHLEVQDGIGGIYGLGVLPEYRRKGYGREILLHAVKKLKEKQVGEIMLQVAVENKNALDLYKSCGFDGTSTMDYYKLGKREEA